MTMEKAKREAQEEANLTRERQAVCQFQWCGSPDRYYTSPEWLVLANRTEVVCWVSPQ